MRLDSIWTELPKPISRKIVLLALLMTETDRLHQVRANLPSILNGWDTETEQNISDVKRIIFERTDIKVSVESFDEHGWELSANKVLENGDEDIIALSTVPIDYPERMIMTWTIG